MIDQDLKQKARLHRQFEALARHAPVPRRFLDALRSNRYRRIRIPAAVLLILGGLLSILPIFGIWMLPLGLMLLAIDIPVLRPRVSAAMIRVRRWWSLRRHKSDADAPPS
jgi:hypothetical protein